MTQISTVSELFAAILDSQLLTDEWLAPYRVWQSREPDSPKDILALMVSDRILTKHQANRILTSRSKNFFIAGKYKLLSHLGSGGMGHVYLCEHLLLHRLVAVKVLQKIQQNAATGVIERFFREARAVAQLDDPNITRVFDMDRIGNTPFMVMEYVDGSDLHTIVSQHGPLTLARVGNYAYQAARGLAHAQRAGLVHRDIKPGNILIERSGVLKILDLGLARFFDDVSRNDNLTATYDNRRIMGTADYMAPEQTIDSTAVDIRSDIYSLGCTLYFLLTGQAPFQDGNVTQKLLWHQLREPKAVSAFRDDVPVSFVAILNRMMAKDPADRFQTAGDLSRALYEYSDSIPQPVDAEMPQTPASAFRLGLTKLPDNRLELQRSAKDFNVGKDTPNPKDSPRSDSFPLPTSSVVTDHFIDISPTNAPEAADLVLTDGGSETPQEPVDVETDGGTANSSLRRWFAFGSVQILLLVLGIVAAWLINRNSKATTSTPPIRKFNVVQFQLAGGGSTFVQSAMNEWQNLYASKSGGTITYEGVGSGNGVVGVIDKTFDFCCTDAYLSPDQLAKGRSAGMELIQIPLVHGAIVPIYNLGEISHGVRFSGPVLASIYLGSITSWNDPLLKKENPQITLPDAKIFVVHRLDSSGSTNIFTDFLRKSSEEWRTKMGDFAANTAKWRVGTGAKGSEGVAKKVNETFGAIGYVELTHALSQPKLSIGHVKNFDGVHIPPTLNSVRLASAELLKMPFPKDFQFSLTNVSGPLTYPIAGTTWAVFDAANPDKEKLLHIVDFLEWVTHDGQTPLTLIYYAPLPDQLVLIIEASLQRIRNPK